MERQRIWAGIDNGISGSLGIIFEDGSYKFYKTPTKSELNYTKVKANITRIEMSKLTEILSIADVRSKVMIERPMVNPTRFKATVSALRAFEATLIVLETLQLPYEYIDSKAWQRELLPKGVAGLELKFASLNIGNRMFPAYFSDKHPDRDGLLIAEFCKRKYK